MIRSIRFNKEEGLTLIELLVVIALVGVVSAISLPILLNTVQNSQNKADTASAAEVSQFTRDNSTAGYIVLDAADAKAIASNNAAGGAALASGNLYAFDNDGKGNATGAPIAQIRESAATIAAAPVVRTQADYEAWFAGLPSHDLTVFVQTGNTVTAFVWSAATWSTMATPGTQTVLGTLTGKTSDSAFQAAWLNRYDPNGTSGSGFTPAQVGLQGTSVTSVLQAASASGWSFLVLTQ